jgi:hypothetical protein
MIGLARNVTVAGGADRRCAAGGHASGTSSKALCTLASDAGAASAAVGEISGGVIIGGVFTFYRAEPHTGIVSCLELLTRSG